MNVLSFPTVLLALVAAGASARVSEARVLFDFDSAAAMRGWRSVNDGVMGGRSDGRVRWNSDGHLNFFGTLSLANNGGFASIRARGDDLALDQDDVIAVRVRGDGREYKFNVYTDANLRSYSYRQSFRTRKDEWIEVELPVKSFVATWRGRVYRNVKLNPGRISGMGILLGDKRPGPFQLDVDWIRVLERGSGD